MNAISEEVLMTALLVLLAGTGIAAAVATVREVVTDGYRAVPTRES